MGFKNGILIGLGIILFLIAGDISRKSGVSDLLTYIESIIVGLTGIILVYLGLKREQDEKKDKSK